MSIVMTDFCLPQLKGFRVPGPRGRAGSTARTAGGLRIWKRLLTAAVYYGHGNGSTAPLERLSGLGGLAVMELLYCDTKVRRIGLY